MDNALPIEVVARTVPPPQRADGRLRLGFGRDRAGVSRLRHCFQHAPCRVLFPHGATGEPPQAVLLTTTGGLTGGDRLDIGLDVGPGAGATLSTQAAEKIYRAAPGEPATEIRVALTVGAGAWAEWLAQETILFEGARLRRCLDADLAPGGRLLAVESAVFGRGAMGERMRHGLLFDRWRIRRGGRLIWADAQRLADADLAGERPAFGLDDARAMATLVYVGDGAAQLLAPMRALLDEAPPEAAATCIGDVLIIRMLAADPAAMRRCVVSTGAALRHAAAGLAPALPRVWHC
jgi:urease accessory protein